MWGLHFIHLSVNSVLPKINELRSSGKLTNSAVIGISESIRLYEIHIENYNTLHCASNKNGGGVVCYIRNNLSYKVRSFFFFFRI